MFDETQQVVFGDQNIPFAARQQNLERRRQLARSLIEKGMQGNSGSGYQGGRVFIVGNPLGNIASSIAGNYMDSKAVGEQEDLQRQQEAYNAQQLASIPTGGPERQQAQLRALQNPSLRQTIAAQMGIDEKDAARIERGEQLAADREARAAEKEATRQWQQEQNALYKRTLEQAIALKQAPSVVVHAGGGSRSTPEGFGGAAPLIGIDPRTETPVYRHTKSGQLFRYDENGQPVPHEGAIGPKPTAVGQPTESERSSAGYLGRMQEAEKNLGSIQGGEQTELTMAAGKLPLVGEYARRKVETTAQQKYRQSADDWIRAKLRKESGAVIGKDEMEAEYRTYFPQPGDTPEVIQQKAQSRAQAEQQMLSSAGRSKPTAAKPVGPTVVRTGKDASGRKVEQLSDGTVRYAN